MRITKEQASGSSLNGGKIMMYEIVIKNYVGGKRKPDSIFTKKYQRKGNAERKAKELTKDINDSSYTEAYVRGTLVAVTKDMAKAAYCNSTYVYIDTENGQERLRPSWHYGSHAPARELFYTSITAKTNWWEPYKGNFYIESDKIEWVEQRIRDGFGEGI